jgi:hypothetical protein
MRKRVEFYLRQNINSVAKENNIKSGCLNVTDVNFIADNRVLISFKDQEDQDNYLAEAVFSEGSNSVRIEKFILKIKNSVDYSNGVYGAD